MLQLCKQIILHFVETGSKIDGGCFNASLSTEGQSITLSLCRCYKRLDYTIDSTSNVTGQPILLQQQVEQ
jgi:hypothetical protein